jgi:hypothetical protein
MQNRSPALLEDLALELLSVKAVSSVRMAGFSTIVLQYVDSPVTLLLLLSEV